MHEINLPELAQFTVVFTGNVANGNLMREFSNYKQTEVCLAAPLLIDKSPKKCNVVMQELFSVLQAKFPHLYSCTKKTDQNTVCLLELKDLQRSGKRFRVRLNSLCQVMTTNLIRLYNQSD